jgi:hypothetical protein
MREPQKVYTEPVSENVYKTFSKSGGQVNTSSEKQYLLTSDDNIK